MPKFSNPIAFTKGPVTFFTTLVYAALIVALIIVHTTVPPVPANLPHGVNITEAWLDLQHLTSSFHPYNSHSNDDVRHWLLLRIHAILSNNEVHSSNGTDPSSAHVFVFDDNYSNLTLSSVGGVGGPGVSVYFEGTNIIVYIRGSGDDNTEWWKDVRGKPKGKGGVLVNAHYDSVSTGFGATDDGVGVISILQLIKFYTTPGNVPKKGLVALLNNGEEDFLNGANVFSQHPISRFPRTFLNLEGAGAGGRAMLFRSTDTEVTRAYKNSPYPFGSVVTSDGFNRGLVRSQTDYVVFNGILGMRGLDVAFFEPRARYHTSQDDTRHTTKNSLWHMLSAALATTKSLTSDSSDNTKQGSRGVWFDLFGRGFGVFQLHTVFALSVTLLVVAPLFILLTLITVHRVDKLYLFSSSKLHHTFSGDESIPLYGWRGFFRFPLILAAACAAPVALAYLLSQENKYIAHGNEWSVWSMLLSSFVVVAWVLCRTADYIRPSALTRAYGFCWLSLGWWAALVTNTVLETQFQMAGGYFVLIFYAAVALATWLSLLELFALPRKAEHCREKIGVVSRPASGSSGQLLGSHQGRSSPDCAACAEDSEAEHLPEDNEDEADERTGLLADGRRSTLANYSREDDDQAVASGGDGVNQKRHVAEQDWSDGLPSWMWLLQFILVAPIVIIVVGQISLLIVSALHQTGQDGSSVLLIYLLMAAFAILILSPLVPFLHRTTWHVPMFLLLVLVGTLIYNLTAFPFSSNNRLKLFFQQEMDFDSGLNTVSLIGVTPFVQEAVQSIPSAAGQDLACVPVAPGDRVNCSWSGLPPNIRPSSNLPLKAQYKYWVMSNVTRTSFDSNKARFTLRGQNTRACKIKFDAPISDFNVHGSGPKDKRFDAVPYGGSREIRLWSRTWNRTWTVDVEWEGQGEQEGKATSMTGRVLCLWSDANHEGVIPALDEARHYLPNWVAITKYADGLVEGGKRFSI